jgi:hypothetical protein
MCNRTEESAGPPTLAGDCGFVNSRSAVGLPSGGNDLPFPALGTPMSPAWVHRCPHVEDLALPKSLRSGNFILAKAVIWWMSVITQFSEKSAGRGLQSARR